MRTRGSASGKGYLGKPDRIPAARRRGGGRLGRDRRSRRVAWRSSRAAGSV